MAAEDHLKIAASELAKAAELLRFEVNQLRGDEANTRQRMSQQIADMNNQLQTLQMQASRATDPQDNSRVQTSITVLLRQIGDTKKNMDDEIKRLANLISSKEKDISAIESQVRMVSP